MVPPSPQTPARPAATLSVGEVARRSGIAVSAVHFYERKGLITAQRSGGNQRRYGRDVLRRIAIIRAALVLGIPLKEVGLMLGALPPDRAPSAEDWQKIARSWSESLDMRINLLKKLRDDLGACIGCGCLSMRHCAIFNPQDARGDGHAGSLLLGESFAD